MILAKDQSQNFQQQNNSQVVAWTTGLPDSCTYVWTSGWHPRWPFWSLFRTKLNTWGWKSQEAVVGFGSGFKFFFVGFSPQKPGGMILIQFDSHFFKTRLNPPTQLEMLSTFSESVVFTRMMLGPKCLQHFGNLEATVQSSDMYHQWVDCIGLIG